MRRPSQVWVAPCMRTSIGSWSGTVPGCGGGSAEAEADGARDSLDALDDEEAAGASEEPPSRAARAARWARFRASSGSSAAGAAERAAGAAVLDASGAAIGLAAFDPDVSGGCLIRYDPVVIRILTAERWNESAAPPSGTARKRAALIDPSS